MQYGRIGARRFCHVNMRIAVFGIVFDFDLDSDGEDWLIVTNKMRERTASALE